MPPNPNLLGDIHPPRRTGRQSTSSAPNGRRPAITASQRSSAGNGLPGSRSPEWLLGRRAATWVAELQNRLPHAGWPKSSFPSVRGPGCAGQQHARAHGHPPHTFLRQSRQIGRCKRSAPTERQRQQPQANPPDRAITGKKWFDAGRTDECRAEWWPRAQGDAEQAARGPCFPSAPSGGIHGSNHTPDAAASPKPQTRDV